MDRKGLLIIIITLGLAFAYSQFIAKPKNEEALKTWKAAEEKRKTEEAAAIAAKPVKAPDPKPGETPLESAPVVAAPTTVEEQKRIMSKPGSAEYVFSNLGGGISRVVLKEHFENKDTKTPIVLNEFGAFPIGALSEKPGSQEAREGWTLDKVDDAAGTISFSKVIPGLIKNDKGGDVQWIKASQIKVVKTFTVPQAGEDKKREVLRGEFLVKMDVTYTNVGDKATAAPPLYLHTGSAAAINQHEQGQYLGFDYYRDGGNNFKSSDTFAAGGMLWWKHDERPIFTSEKPGLVRWAGVTSQYFTTLVTVLGGEDRPEEEQRAMLGEHAWAKRVAITPDQWKAATEWRPKGHELTVNHAFFNIDGAIELPPGKTLNVGESQTLSYQIYAGPREYRRLRLFDHSESAVLDYGSFLGILPTGPFSRLLLNGMNWLYGMVNSYALAIVLLTILVKAVLWPLQNKANNNMKKMADLQPEMKRLQEKYKEEPVKFQQEMGKMWKKAGVNPLSGCWPIFIQVPIFIGFYNMLGKAVELRHHGFLWVKDLAAPDTIARIAGIDINPLPLLMAATMFLQMKLAPQGGDPAQRKLFMFMPLIFVFMCYNFASALALYWAVQNIISIVQLMVNRHKAKTSVQVVPGVTINTAKIMGATPKEMLDTMLGHLDFAFEIKEFETGGGITLQIYSPEKERLLGRRGETLDELQALLNRMLLAQNPSAPRVVVDVEHWREMKDDTLLQRVRQIADIVRKSGRPMQLEPMNSYQRRLVHNSFKEDPEVATWSPPDDAKLKRITIRKRTH